MERRAPMRCVAKRAMKSAPPQVSAVRSPSKIPMRPFCHQDGPADECPEVSLAGATSDGKKDEPACSLLIRGHAALQFLKPIQHNVDLRRRGSLLLVGLEHQEALAVR